MTNAYATYEKLVGQITPEEFVAPFLAIAFSLEGALNLAIEELNNIWVVSDNAADDIRAYVISKLS